jgi:hypothetical protein
MPLLYGEGDRAFIRLQEEIIRISNDHSIFAWGFDHKERDNLCPVAKARFQETGLLLASTARQFESSGRIFGVESTQSQPHSLTNIGLQITLPLAELDSAYDGDDHFVALLSCGVNLEEDNIHYPSGHPEYCVGIWLRSPGPWSSTYARVHADSGVASGLFKITSVSHAKTKPVFITHRSQTVSEVRNVSSKWHLNWLPLDPVIETYSALGPPVAIIPSTVQWELPHPNRPFMTLNDNTRYQRDFVIIHHLKHRKIHSHMIDCVIFTLVKDVYSLRSQIMIRQSPLPKDLNSSWCRKDWEKWAESLELNMSAGTGGFEKGDHDGWLHLEGNRQGPLDVAIRARLEVASIHHHQFYRLKWESKYLK